MLGLYAIMSGLTQAGLAARLSFTQTTLSRYEAGHLGCPRTIIWWRSRRVLNRPLSFFYRDDRRYATSGFYHRKRSRLSAKDGKRVNAQVNDLRIQANMLLYEAQIESAYRFHQLGSVVCGSPEHSARSYASYGNCRRGRFGMSCPRSNRPEALYFRANLGPTGSMGLVNGRWIIRTLHLCFS